jgi:hypothetical protein
MQYGVLEKFSRSQSADMVGVLMYINIYFEVNETTRLANWRESCKTSDSSACQAGTCWSNYDVITGFKIFYQWRMLHNVLLPNNIRILNIAPQKMTLKSELSRRHILAYTNMCDSRSAFQFFFFV